MNNHPEQVINRACEIYGITREQFIGQDRSGEILKARYAVSHVYTFLGMTLSEIARRVKRDRTSVRNALPRADELLHVEPGFTYIIAELKDAALPGITDQKENDMVSKSLRKIEADLKRIASEEEINRDEILLAARRINAQAEMLELDDKHHD